MELTKEQFLKVLPKKMKKTVNDGIMDAINNVVADPTIRDAFRENIISYTSVMKDGKFKMQQYLEAVHYVSYKLFGSSNIEAYCKTFPHRYQRFLDEGFSDKAISSYVNAYNNNKLVNLILEQTLVPTHILNADLYQKALNTQAELMMTSGSDKVRCDAANSLLTHLKMPETQKVELDVSVKEDKAITELRNATLDLVEQQKKALASGSMNVREIAHSKLLVENADGTFVEEEHEHTS